MKNNSQLAFIGRIIEKMPPNVTPVDYLEKTLGLNKSMIQQRLRGRTPFTFEEVLILSKNLNFSADKILLNKNTKHALFKIQNGILVNAKQAFFSMLLHYKDNLGALKNACNIQVIVSANRLICIFVQYFPNLFKFTYYKWVHQFGDLPLNYTFSELEVSDKIKLLCKEITSLSHNLNFVFIIDKNIILNTIREIKYFIDRELIRKEEALIIKEELRRFVEIIYTSLLSNSSNNHTNSEMYLSSIKIESNTFYMACNNIEFSYYWIFSDSHIYTSDPNICRLHKDWLDSLKKYSTLISHSNQKMQAEFYNEISEQLEELVGE